MRGPLPSASGIQLTDGDGYVLTGASHHASADWKMSHNEPYVPFLEQLRSRRDSMFDRVVEDAASIQKADHPFSLIPDRDLINPRDDG